MFNKLDQLLETATGSLDLPSDLPKVELSDNFLMETALFYADALESDIQLETVVAKMDSTFGALLESGMSPEDIQTKANEILLEGAKEFGESAVEKFKKMIAWVIAQMEKVKRYITEKFTSVDNYLDKYGEKLKKLKDYKDVTYKGHKFDFAALDVVDGLPGKAFDVLREFGFTGKPSAEEAEEVLKEYDSKKFRSALTKALIGDEAEDAIRKLKEKAVGKEEEIKGFSYMAPAKMVDWLSGKKAFDEKATKAMEAVKKDLITHQKEAEVLAKESKKDDKANGTKLATYASKKAVVVQLAIGIVQQVIDVRLQVSTQAMTEFMAAGKKGLRKGGEIKDDDKDQNLNESAFDVIGMATYMEV